jgi:RNA polymerase sigma factor (TIGR02999 family)
MAKDITQLLVDWNSGDAEALERLMPLVYDELHRLAERHMRGERRDHTLQPTALVHEAYLRLIDQTRVEWQNRRQFFGVAATLMRRIILKHARRNGALKRGGGIAALPLDEELLPSLEKADHVIAVDEALGQLEAIDPRQAKVVELRFFCGFTIEEAAGIMGLSPATVKREWAMARAWLTHEIDNSGVRADLQ